MRLIVGLAFLLVATDAAAQRFRIEESTDALTRESYLQASGLKLCQVKSAGFAAQCAVLQLVWERSTPDLVAIRIEIPDLTSVLEVAARVGGEVRRYGAEVPVTDIDYSSGLQMAAGAGFSSANVFVLPIEALRSLSSDEDSGLLRVSGTHTSFDFDFWRKAKARGLPADELREFVTRIERDLEPQN